MRISEYQYFRADTLYKNKLKKREDYNQQDNIITRKGASDLHRKLKKPILLLIGEPGTGKSWLAYQLASELINEGYEISIFKSKKKNQKTASMP